ncbi:MAG: hypothetical protein NTZ28_03745 [Nitrospirae bacterium]|nr:hypothetical protein [Nitrospirota bacterium]
MGFISLSRPSDYPIGYPHRFRETLIVDSYTRQSDLVGQRNNAGVEIGLRHQLSPRIVLDGGLGTELAGPSDRSAITARLACPSSFHTMLPFGTLFLGSRF